MVQDILIPALIIGALGLAFGLFLSYASKKFAVKTNPKVDKVIEVLPGANCGACGYSGCEGFAKAVVAGKTKVEGCTVGGKETADKVAGILGVEAGQILEKKARVMCSGKIDVCNIKYEYEGLDSCLAATSLYGGDFACRYACLGKGDCVEVCDFEAIEIVDGLARIIQNNCTGCGKCVKVCPKNIIRLVQGKNKYSVLCSNPDKGAITRQVCKEGCIGCTKCVKICPVEAISMDGSLARIDDSKCIGCGKCVDTCPTNAIKEIKFC